MPIPSGQLILFARRAIRYGLAAMLSYAVLTTAQEDNTIFRGEFDPAPQGHLRRSWQLIEHGALIYRPGHYAILDEGEKQCVVSECQVVNRTTQPETGNTVYANETGKTYWITAVGPNSSVPFDPVFRGGRLKQLFYFRRNSQNAALTLIVTNAVMQLWDAQGISFGPLGNCPYPYDTTFAVPDDCGAMLAALTSFSVKAATALSNNRIDDSPAYRVKGKAMLSGQRFDWKFNVANSPNSNRPLWERSDFSLETDGQTIIAELKTPYPVEIPLDHIEIGDIVTLEIELFLSATNKIKGKSSSRNSFRDPFDLGVEIKSEGLEPTEGPVDHFPGHRVTPAALCPGSPDPSAGMIALDTRELRVLESPANDAFVNIVRTGGSEGEISARIRTRPDSAERDEDYQHYATIVRFGDGELGSRTAVIALFHDDIEEPDESFIVELLDPRGCATLGALSAMTVIIVNDDIDSVGDEHSIGGTVSGLQGDGLRLQQGFETLDIAGNGVFEFDRQVSDGASYQVSIERKPSLPVQHCTIANGAGMVQSRDVTDVEGNCHNPALSHNLDSSFGFDGRVTDEFAGGAVSIGIQSDGRLIAASAIGLYRYGENGEVDASFGDGGAAPLGDPTALATSLTIQADDKIVVVVESQDDYFIHRFASNGTPDSTFGAAGKVTVDVSGGFDRAVAVASQPDGKIITAGYANGDYAVVRLNTNGQLDMSFADAGVAIIDVGGAGDNPAGLATQSDGKIVIAGRAGGSRANESDIGLIRLNSDGSLDATFATAGILVDATPNIEDSAVDVKIQSDGKLVVAAGSR